MDPRPCVTPGQETSPLQTIPCRQAAHPPAGPRQRGDRSFIRVIGEMSIVGTRDVPGLTIRDEIRVHLLLRSDRGGATRNNVVWTELDRVGSKRKVSRQPTQLWKIHAGVASSERSRNRKVRFECRALIKRAERWLCIAE